MGWVSAAPGSLEERRESAAVAERLDVQACGLNHFTVITDPWDKEAGEGLSAACEQVRVDVERERRVRVRACARSRGNGLAANLEPRVDDQVAGESVAVRRWDAVVLEGRWADDE